MSSAVVSNSSGSSDFESEISNAGVISVKSFSYFVFLPPPFELVTFGDASMDFSKSYFNESLELYPKSNVPACQQSGDAFI